MDINLYTYVYTEREDEISHLAMSDFIASKESGLKILSIDIDINRSMDTG